MKVRACSFNNLGAISHAKPSLNVTPDRNDIPWCNRFQNFPTPHTQGPPIQRHLNVLEISDQLKKCEVFSWQEAFDKTVSFPSARSTIYIVLVLNGSHNFNWQQH